jgi:hypothetical protein
MRGHRCIDRPAVAWAGTPRSRGRAAEEFPPRDSFDSAWDFSTLVLAQRHIWERAGRGSRGNSSSEMASRLL